MDRYVKSGAAFILLLCAISCNEIARKTGHYELNETCALAEGRTDSISLSTRVQNPEFADKRERRFARALPDCAMEPVAMISRQPQGNGQTVVLPNIGRRAMNL